MQPPALWRVSMRVLGLDEVGTDRAEPDLASLLLYADSIEIRIDSAFHY